jgi:glycosyltransferase involved in cell wall biosynthesis
LVICSYIQAYLDLGCEVEFVFIRTRDKTPSSAQHFKDIVCTVVDARNQTPSRYARLAYWAGRPRKLSWQLLYPSRNVLLQEVKNRISKDDRALHVFYSLVTANVIPSLPKARTIWVCPDIESEYESHDFAVNQELENRTPYAWEKRQLRRLLRLEREVARRSGLVLCVSRGEATQIAEQWSVPHAAHLPMSIASSDSRVVPEKPGSSEELRLLHIGVLENPACFTSLEFLLTKVFPLLDAETVSRLKLEVAGKSDIDGAWFKAIRELARPYPMVRFSGFVEDIRTVYRRSDLQVVASTQATGTRTRVVESWAIGMPVLSTTVGAGGVDGVEPGRNILIADDPRDFARILRELVHAPNRLKEIATAAHRTYEALYSRRAVATALRKLLNSRFGMQLPAVSTLLENNQGLNDVS